MFEQKGKIERRFWVILGTIARRPDQGKTDGWSGKKLIGHLRRPLLPPLSKNKHSCVTGQKATTCCHSWYFSQSSRPVEVFFLQASIVYQNSLISGMPVVCHQMMLCLWQNFCSIKLCKKKRELCWHYFFSSLDEVGGSIVLSSKVMLLLCLWISELFFWFFNGVQN